MTAAERVNLRGDALRPRFVGGELAGIDVLGELIPFPGVGLETELGSVLPGSAGETRSELQRVLDARDGIPADPPSGAWVSCYESGRQFDELGSTYLEGVDHFELNTFLHRGANAARANLEARLLAAGRLVARAGSPIILHATGGDGHGNTFSSLHVNVPISDRTYDCVLADQRFGAHIFDYHLAAQLTLSVVDGNGGIGDDEYSLSDRIDAFDRVFGTGTVRPNRAMVVDRAEGFGCARIMNMLRALSFGRASAAGFLATQIDCLVMQLVVHGVLVVPSIPVGDPIEAGRHFALCRNRREAAGVQSRVQAVRRAVFDALVRALGSDVAVLLLPDAPELLDFIDEVLLAVEQDDEAALVATTDWARKWQMVRALQGARRTTWEATRSELIELNVHWARLDDRALRHRFPGSAFPWDAVAGCAPVDTSSWLLHAVVSRALRDAEWRESLSRTSISWKGFSCTSGRWVEPVGSYFPYASSETRRLDLVPWSHTLRTHGAALASATSILDLLDAFGVTATVYGSYAGESRLYS